MAHYLNHEVCLQYCRISVLLWGPLKLAIHQQKENRANIQTKTYHIVCHIHHL